MQLQGFTASIAMAITLALGTATVAQAQPHGPRHGGPAPHAHGPQHAHPGWRPGPSARPKVHPGSRPPPPAAHRYRGAGPRHNWYKGSRLPAQYYAPRYIVHDWRAHRLHQPPRGHQWVRYGGDFMLVAIASGVITQLLIQGMY